MYACILRNRRSAYVRLLAVRPPNHFLTAGSRSASSLAFSVRSLAHRDSIFLITVRWMCSLRATNRGLSSMTLCLLLVTMSSSPSMSRKSACISPTRYFENIPPSLMLPSMSSCMILPLAIMAILLLPSPMSSCLFAVPTHPLTLYPPSSSTVPSISSLHLHRPVILSPSLPMYQTYSRLFR